MLYTGNPYLIKPGNIFFMHMILMDSENQLAMNLGETYLVTDNGNERLGKQKLGCSLIIFIFYNIYRLHLFLYNLCQNYNEFCFLAKTQADY